MTDFTVKIANKIISVTAFFESTKEYCRDFLYEGTPDFSAVISTADIEFERAQTIKINEKEGEHLGNLSESFLEIVAVQRKVTEFLLDHNTLLFHGSVVAVDGKAYLFTAKSGTGKSTHTRLWREMLGERAVMVNDDKPFVSVSDSGITVHGSPWNGKHRLGSNISVPLCSFCILERGINNEINRIPASKAIFMLIQQSSRPRDPEKLTKYMELLDSVASKVSFYRLACNMEPEAAKISFEAMSKGE